MNEKIEKAIMESLNTVDGLYFLQRRYSNRQEIANLSEKTMNLIREYNLSVSEATGFCDYMKFVIAAYAYLPTK